MTKDTQHGLLQVLQSKGSVVALDGSRVILDCRGGSLDEQDFLSLGDFQEMEIAWLSCDDLYISQIALDSIFRIGSLEYLSLCNCQIESGQLSELKRLQGLEILRLHGLQNLESFSSKIDRLPNLASLDISHSDCDASVLAELIAVGTLEDIKVNGTGISREDVLLLDCEQPGSDRLVSVQLGDGSHITISVQRSNNSNGIVD